MIGGMMNGFGFGGFGLVGLILNLVITIGLIVGIVVLVVWLVGRFTLSQQGSSISPYQTDTQSTPREILQTRYARGEITRDDYKQMLSDLV
ncbi:MAG: SHOCT domain-containing protein [Anaerolineales bacterium]|nr:SHOCT domain-containing protein [Anaerolineales bacterium]